MKIDYRLLNNVMVMICFILLSISNVFLYLGDNVIWFICLILLLIVAFIGMGLLYKNICKENPGVFV